MRKYLKKKQENLSSDEAKLDILITIARGGRKCVYVCVCLHLIYFITGIPASMYWRAWNCGLSQFLGEQMTFRCESENLKWMRCGFGWQYFALFYLPVCQVMRAILPHSNTFFIRFKWNDEKTTLELLKKRAWIYEITACDACVFVLERARRGWAAQKLLFAISMLKWWSQMVCNKFNHLLLNHKRWVFCSRTHHAHAALLDFSTQINMLQARGKKMEEKTHIARTHTHTSMFFFADCSFHVLTRLKEEEVARQTHTQRLEVLARFFMLSFDSSSLNL